MSITLLLCYILRRLDQLEGNLLPKFGFKRTKTKRLSEFVDLKKFADFTGRTERQLAISLDRNYRKPARSTQAARRAYEKVPKTKYISRFKAMLDWQVTAIIELYESVDKESAYGVYINAPQDSAVQQLALRELATYFVQKETKKPDT